VNLGLLFCKLFNEVAKKEVLVQYKVSILFEQSTDKEFYKKEQEIDANRPDKTRNKERAFNCI
jgi:hypothetical protein